MELLRYILNRLNVKAIAMLICVLLVIGGGLMIFTGIKDDGFIDVKSPFLTGQVKSGFVGVMLIFCAVVVLVGSLYTRKSRHEFTIKKGQSEFHWKGTFSTSEELALVQRMIHKKLIGSEEDEGGQNVAAPDKDSTAGSS